MFRHLDALDFETMAAVISIAAVAGVVLFVGSRKPKARDFDAEGYYPGYDRVVWSKPDGEAPLSASVSEGFVQDDSRDRPSMSWSAGDGQPLSVTISDGREPMILGEELEVKFPGSPPVGIALDPKSGLPALRPDTEYAMKRHAVMAAHIATVSPRYVVPSKKQAGGGLYWVTDTREGTGRITTGPRYTRRSSALRAARRLNAKEAAK